ncbi:hypothetical protein DYBT9275_03156 [Dyadobacter sp. CECT 9275]|uniref:ABC transport system permease protein n=1 Tax=Dyadobacter helix TaxID=2822344 RepID=A0A916N542_9BACT|nr:ABC transporter permease [Dyadobacter sp. CECT 9275]CAG5003452.1 hypothetical protein DYBT9275_03156 [Dyadobacter sp. CECT 9275]
MLKNYLKVAIRNIWKNRVFSVINIVGLSVGMATCMVIMLFVLYERSFDTMHAKNLYRLNEIQTFEGSVNPQRVALSMPPMAPTLQREYPEILNATRVNYIHKAPIAYQGKLTELPSLFCVDTSFLEMFNFILLKGDTKTVFKDPNSIVLSEESAKRMFGDENPVGKIVSYYRHDTLSFRVTGITASVPAHSHMQFDGLVLLDRTADPKGMNRWDGNWLTTYLELDQNVDIASLEAKFPAYLRKYMGDNSRHYQLFLQPLVAIHAGSGDIMHDYINFQKFDQNHTDVFWVIAIIVLVIACVNFMNLSTAHSTGRTKEVGVRKSIGAKRFQLATQFLGESVLLAVIAFALALVLTRFSVLYAVQLSGRKLDPDVYNNPGLMALLLGGSVLIGIISGLYPAVFLSSFETIKVLKGTLRVGKSNLRNVLVVLQFGCAVCLIIAAVFAVLQLRYMREMNPGFEKEQVVVIPLGTTSWQKYTSLKQEFLSSPYIEAVTASRQRLGNNLNQTGIEFKGKGALKEMSASHVVVDPDYLSLYKIKLVAGRNFRDDAADNGTAYIVNETLARTMLKDEPGMTMEDLLGKRFGFDSLGTIVGICKDFNFNSAHHTIETLFLYNQKGWAFREFSVRIKGKYTQQALAALQSAWESQLKGQPFTYSFLDEHFEELYSADDQVSRIVSILAVLAIFIACLGLFGLASYSTERRAKEIGLRKVLGASVSGIVTMLCRDFLRLVLIGIVMATPVAWWLVNAWLKDFAYRVDIVWWVFTSTAGMALGVAFLTISFQSIKAAIANPVESLKEE